MATTEDRPPEGCTCTYTTSFYKDGSTYRAIFIAAQDCPARPHPRAFRTPPEPDDG